MGGINIDKGRYLSKIPIQRILNHIENKFYITSSGISHGENCASFSFTFSKKFTVLNKNFSLLNILSKDNKLFIPFVPSNEQLLNEVRSVIDETNIHLSIENEEISLKYLTDIEMKNFKDIIIMKDKLKNFG
jgi:hypothetical protein